MQGDDCVCCIVGISRGRLEVVRELLCGCNICSIGSVVDLDNLVVRVRIVGKSCIGFEMHML